MLLIPKSRTALVVILYSSSKQLKFSNIPPSLYSVCGVLCGLDLNCTHTNWESLIEEMGTHLFWCNTSLWESAICKMGHSCFRKCTETFFFDVLLLNFDFYWTGRSIFSPFLPCASNNIYAELCDNLFFSDLFPFICNCFVLWMMGLLSSYS